MPMVSLLSDGGCKMSKHLLTNIIVGLVNEYSNANEYGVSLITIPDFDYAQFAQSLSNRRKSELYFLGFQMIRGPH